jgi:hypothetical protein
MGFVGFPSCEGCVLCAWLHTTAAALPVAPRLKREILPLLVLLPTTFRMGALQFTHPDDATLVFPLYCVKRVKRKMKLYPLYALRREGGLAKQ